MSRRSGLSYVLRDGVAEIILARPDRLNALTPELLTEFAVLLDRTVADGARALLLRGEGRAFCSGADLRSDDDDAAYVQDRGLPLEHFFNPVAQRLHDLPIPVVAAVQGAAAGAGCSLALAADFVIAGRSAYFLLAFVNIGLVPDMGATWILPRIVGSARAMEMMMLGERLSSEKAEAWGLIHRQVEDDQVEAAARGLALRLAQGPTLALGLIRQAVRNAATRDMAGTLHQERLDQKAAGNATDFREGIAAFTEKRAARFTGH